LNGWNDLNGLFPDHDHEHVFTPTTITAFILLETRTPTITNHDHVYFPITTTFSPVFLAPNPVDCQKSFCPILSLSLKNLNRVPVLSDEGVEGKRLNPSIRLRAG
jgi:hypothetical protein